MTLALMILAYLSVAVGVSYLAGTKKAKVVPELTGEHGYGDDYSYKLRYTSAQDSDRLFWEWQKWLAFIWPVQITLGFLGALVYGVVRGIGYLSNGVESRGKLIAKRSTVAKLPEEYAKAVKNAPSENQRSRRDRQQLEALTKLLDQYGATPNLVHMQIEAPKETVAA